MGVVSEEKHISSRYSELDQEEGVRVESWDRRLQDYPGLHQSLQSPSFNWQGTFGGTFGGTFFGGRRSDLRSHRRQVERYLLHNKGVSIPHD